MAVLYNVAHQKLWRDLRKHVNMSDAEKHRHLAEANVLCELSDEQSCFATRGKDHDVWWQHLAFDHIKPLAILPFGEVTERFCTKHRMFYEATWQAHWISRATLKKPHQKAQETSVGARVAVVRGDRSVCLALVASVTEERHAARLRLKDGRVLTSWKRYFEIHNRDEAFTELWDEDRTVFISYMAFRGTLWGAHRRHQKAQERKKRI